MRCNFRHVIGVWMQELTAAVGPAMVRDAQVHAVYDAAKYQWLAALKAKYDPENIFRSNQHFRPVGEHLS